MKLYGVLHDGEAEAGAALLARASLVDAIEAFEEAGELLFLHPTPIVLEADAVLGGSALKERYVDILSLGVGDGVLGEVAEDGGDEREVALDDDGLGDVGVQGQPFAFRHDGEFAGDVGNEGGDVHGLALDEGIAILHTGDERHIGEQAAETLVVGIAALDEFLTLLLAEVDAREQGLEAYPDGGHGSLQFVVDVVGELALEARLLLLGLHLVDALDAGSYASGDEVGQYADDKADGDHHPEEGPVGLEQIPQGGCIGYGGAHDGAVASGGRVEVFASVTGRESSDVVARTLLHGLGHLGTLAVVVERVGRQHIVVHHLARERDDRYAQLLEGLCVAAYALLVVFTIVDGTYEVTVVELQLGIDEVGLVLLLPRILEADEAQDDSPQADDQYGEQLLVVGLFSRGSHSRILNGLQCMSHRPQSWSAGG